MVALLSSNGQYERQGNRRGSILAQQVHHGQNLVGRVVGLGREDALMREPFVGKRGNSERQMVRGRGPVGREGAKGLTLTVRWTRNLLAWTTPAL